MSHSINFSSLSNIGKAEVYEDLSKKDAVYVDLLALVAAVSAIVFTYFALTSTLSMITIKAFIGMEIVDLTAMLYLANRSLNFKKLAEVYDNEARRKLATYVAAAYSTLVIGVCVLAGFNS